MKRYREDYASALGCWLNSSEDLQDRETRLVGGVWFEVVRSTDSALRRRDSHVGDIPDDSAMLQVRSWVWVMAAGGAERITTQGWTLAKATTPSLRDAGATPLLDVQKSEVLHVVWILWPEKGDMNPVDGDSCEPADRDQRSQAQMFWMHHAWMRPNQSPERPKKSSPRRESIIASTIDEPHACRSQTRSMRRDSATLTTYSLSCHSSCTLR